MSRLVGVGAVKKVAPEKELLEKANKENAELKAKIELVEKEKEELAKTNEELKVKIAELEKANKENAKK